MKFLVFGAGVLGCNLANNLFRAGKDVTLLARGPWADEIRRNGLRIKNTLSRRTAVSPIPVAAELDLKAAARSVGEKSVAMIHVADINKVTGYVRGGCSPVGMKKQYRTVFDESVLTQQKVYVSGGRIGTQVCCAPADLIRAARADTAKIIF